MICENKIFNPRNPSVKQRQTLMFVLSFCLLGKPLQAEDKVQSLSDESFSDSGISEAGKTRPIPDDLELFRQQLMALQKKQEEFGQQVETLRRQQSRQIPIFPADNPISLSISGQLNRAFNLLNDGENTDFYPVDNSASPSRLRFNGSGKIDEDLSVGTRIELGLAPDISFQVSQNSQSPGSWFDQRWTEIFFISRKYGKLSLGKGDTASNGTAEVDFSRTDVVQYASIADIAGGMLFRKTGEGILTTLKVSDVFQDRDGLSRQSRLRYDTPEYFGFRLAGSLVTHQRSDAAIFWGREAHGLKAGAAFAVSNPKITDHGLQYDGSLSVLHQKSGLNLTLSSGIEERDMQRDSENQYAKIGWIADFNNGGNTVFGVDHTRSRNLPFPEDSAWSEGFAVIQFIDKISTELYFQYRVYAFDRKSGPEVENIKVSTIGARVKF